MKTKILFPIVAFMLFFLACDEEERGTAPGKVSVVEIIPTNGGAKIVCQLPNDPEVLFAKAYYTNTLGQELFAITSLYNDTLHIRGYNDTNEHTVQVVAVNSIGMQSEPTEVKITPLVSNIQIVKESIEITPDFGGVKISWINPAADIIYTWLTFKEEGAEESVPIYLSSSRKNESLIVRGMDTTPKEFFVMVEDFYDNTTEKVSKGVYTPIFEEEIDKSLWTLVENMSVDGNAWEGQTTNLWDGEIDYLGSNGQGSYAMISRDRNGGQLNFPLDIVIDMGQTDAILNRFTLWQRAYWHNNAAEYFYYQDENFKAFRLYTSDDRQNWTLIAEESLEDPRDSEGRVPEEYIREAIDGHNFDLPSSVNLSRFLKLSITENFGSERYVNISEMTLYGSNSNL
ncbi:DUF4959 domain-containing protein [Alkalitalea saponilacus]|uniref:F5/8 type C domain-containing protein n=1 Tax=Alkalitalea saponilacus TaxID=889453 RepID=A0A1T5AYA6_9BACT|nr:DUF4959 domain-containing protein [Alkalitalea saponilacus]ASB48551.1 hypothetical protein CDL62_05065 [Alkalitalea saponilacus]SKB39998.1 protein of unknown function [Alkalitalea saponilacus]